MHFLYILESEKDGRYYIGVSSDPCRRLIEHNKGLSKSTRVRRPFKLVYKEKFQDIGSAYRRERYLKGLKSSKVIARIVGHRDSYPLCREFKSLRPDFS